MAPVGGTWCPASPRSEYGACTAVLGSSWQPAGRNQGCTSFWTGLRPATPTNVPYIGRTKLEGLWVNAGHGTLGWTHGAGSGKAMAELIGGRVPSMAFNFYGFERDARMELSLNT